MLAIAVAMGGSPADSARPGLRDLVEITDFSGLSPSPDGRYIVFRTERADTAANSYLLEWHAIDVASGAARRIGGGGDPIYAHPGVLEEARPIWLPNGNEIVFPALVDGAIGAWKAFLDGSSIAPLIIRDEDVESLSLSPDGTALTYLAGPSREEIRRAEKQEYDKGILVDGSVDIAQNLFRGASIAGRMASQRLVGYWYVRAGLLWRFPRQKRRYFLSTGMDEPVGTPEPVPPFEPPSTTISAQANSASGYLAEATWDGESRAITAQLGASASRVRCAATICDTGRVSWLTWRPGTTELLISFKDRHRRQALHLWNPGTGQMRLVVQAGGLLSGDRRGSVPCAVTNAAAYCVAASAASPPRLERIDLESGVTTILFDPNLVLRTNYSPKIEFLSWKIDSGETATGTLLIPTGLTARPAPLFINYYSCDGFLRGGEGDEWPIPDLMAAGFLVACLNAIPQKGPQDGVANYRAGLDAVESLIARLSRSGLVDPTKVAMGGLSFGSEVAMWTAMHSKLLAAVSIASGQLEPTGYWIDATPGSDRAAIVRKVWGLGPPQESPSRWELVSPAFNTKRIQVPVLFQLPEQEARMIPELYARLGRAGVPTELYAFPDEDHFKLQPRHRLHVYERNLDWFRYWLQDFRDPDRAKSDQYRRWDALRHRRQLITRSSAP